MTENQEERDISEGSQIKETHYHHQDHQELKEGESEEEPTELCFCRLQMTYLSNLPGNSKFW